MVVIDWPALPQAHAAMAQLDPATIGLALEHHLQVRVQPLANASRRTKGGGWRTVDRAKSKSRGARAEAAIGAFAEVVDRLWDVAAAYENGYAPLPVSTRCVRPVELLLHRQTGGQSANYSV